MFEIPMYLYYLILAGGGSLLLILLAAIFSIKKHPGIIIGEKQSFFAKKQDFCLDENGNKLTVGLTAVWLGKNTNSPYPDDGRPGIIIDIRGNDEIVFRPKIGFDYILNPIKDRVVFRAMFTPEPDIIRVSSKDIPEPKKSKFKVNDAVVVADVQFGSNPPDQVCGRIIEINEIRENKPKYRVLLLSTKLPGRVIRDVPEDEIKLWDGTGRKYCCSKCFALWNENGIDCNCNVALVEVKPETRKPEIIDGRVDKTVFASGWADGTVEFKVGDKIVDTGRPGHKGTVTEVLSESGPQMYRVLWELPGGTVTSRSEGKYLKLLTGPLDANGQLLKVGQKVRWLGEFYSIEHNGARGTIKKILGENKVLFEEFATGTEIALDPVKDKIVDILPATPCECLRDNQRQLAHVPEPDPPIGSLNYVHKKLEDAKDIIWRAQQAAELAELKPICLDANGCPLKVGQHVIWMGDSDTGIKGIIKEIRGKDKVLLEYHEGTVVYTTPLNPKLDDIVGAPNSEIKVGDYVLHGLGIKGIVKSVGINIEIANPCRENVHRTFTSNAESFIAIDPSDGDRTFDLNGKEWIFRTSMEGPTGLFEGTPVACGDKLQEPNKIGWVMILDAKDHPLFGKPERYMCHKCHPYTKPLIGLEIVGLKNEPMFQLGEEVFARHSPGRKGKVVGRTMPGDIYEIKWREGRIENGIDGSNLLRNPQNKSALDSANKELKKAQALVKAAQQDAKTTDCVCQNERISPRAQKYAEKIAENKLITGLHMTKEEVTEILKENPWAKQIIASVITGVVHREIDQYHKRTNLTRAKRGRSKL